MKPDIISLFFTFFFFSIMGWVLEVCFRSILNKKFVNPGLLRCPYLPIYGIGALMIMVLSYSLHGYPLVLKLLSYFFVTTGLELLTGFVSLRFFQKRLWDYSGQPLNYKGHICVLFSVCWIFLASAFEYILLPPYQRGLILLSPVLKITFTVIMFMVMLIDFLAVVINRLFSLTPDEKDDMDKMFYDIAEPLLSLSMVKNLSQFEHHRNKTRLEHVKEVSYISFLLGKKFSLDCDAIVRGALLHDLFYYDWLRGGPRLHGFKHSNIALRNARKVTILSKKEEDIIKKHMWPLTIMPPIYLESFIVSVVDTFCSTRDYISTTPLRLSCIRREMKK